MDHFYMFNQFKMLFDALKQRTPSRENSMAITKLEESIMWFNKDRANKYEITQTETHIN